MSSLNKVMILGNLGKNPEFRRTTSGTAVASFSIATSERFKNKSGEWEDKTEWHNVVIWNKLAEICEKFLTKGKCVFIEGKLQTRKWTDKEGKDHWNTEIIGERMQMIGGKTDNHEHHEEKDSGSNTRQQHQSRDSDPSYDDEMPF